MLSELGRPAIARFLLEDSPEHLRMMYELWDGYSGLPGLLSGEGYRRTEEGQYYDLRAKRIVSEARLREAVRRVSAEASLRMRRHTQRMQAGSILLLLWLLSMRNEMKSLYKSVWLASGMESDQLFYEQVAEEFDRLDLFAIELMGGSRKNVVNRAGMYGAYGNGLFQNAHLEAFIRGGRYREAKRILGANENHCYESGERPGCIELAQLGWIPIRAMLPIGGAACYSNCKCRIIYR